METAFEPDLLPRPSRRQSLPTESAGKPRGGQEAAQHPTNSNFRVLERDAQQNSVCKP